MGKQSSTPNLPANQVLATAIETAAVTEKIGAMQPPDTMEFLFRHWQELGPAAMASQDRRVEDPPKGPLERSDFEAWYRRHVSPHPDRLAFLAKACARVEARLHNPEIGKLRSCGEAWGRVVRLFWPLPNAREASRTFGLHRCKSRYCPTCGRQKSRQRTETIEKAILLAQEWGIRPEHIRFLTLTIPNGPDIPTLRKQAHRAWAKLQRRRGWSRRVFGWFRCTECITGKDGNWNLHMHVVLLLWSQRIPYSWLWNEWASAVGERSNVDIDRLHTQKFRDARRQGGASAAIRYVAKYLSKSEMEDLEKGPGGLLHHVRSTRGMRAFAMGGGAAVLRRFSEVLLPNWARRLEGIREDTFLREGMPAYRQEDINPETGEVFDTPVMSPALDAHDRALALALAGPLLQMGDSVGEPCGPRHRFRRIGHLPGASRPISVKAFEAWKQGGLRGNPTLPNPAQGLRALVADGDWNIEYTLIPAKDSRPARKYREVLPAHRVAWRKVCRELWNRLVADNSVWGQRRKAAFRKAATIQVTELMRRDTAGSILSAVHAEQARNRIQARPIHRAFHALERITSEPRERPSETPLQPSLEFVTG